MKSHLGIALVTAAAVGCAGLLIAGADAQDAAAPAPQAPANAQPLSPPPPGARDFGPRQGGRGGFMGRMSAQDRAAFFDAHIAAVKAGLELTPDQDKLWGPVEEAVRDAVKNMIAQRQQTAQAGRPADPIARLRLQGDAATARGDALHKLADAAQPLWASLSDDQKRRLPVLMHGMRGRGGMEQRGGGQRRGDMQPPNGARERMGALMQRFQRGGDDGNRQAD
jgi:zinc resistance-associated protein